MVRIKQRYILGELVFELDNYSTGQPIEGKQVLECCRHGVQDAFGDLGAANLRQNF